MKGLSAIIPVKNESAVIGRTLTHLKGLQRSGPLEIIVVDCSRRGTTLQAVRSEPVIKIQASGGRGLQMNRGAAEASGDVLLFLHADTRLPPDAFAWIRRALAQRHIVGGAFRLGIRSNRNAFRIIEYAANLRSKLTRIPYGDQAIFIRKAFFQRIGGFEEIPIMEDVALMQCIKKTGGKISILPVKVQTSPRRWETEGIIYGTLRNWILISLYYFGVPPQRLVKFYP